jgi:hypothetical protein
VDKKSTLEFRQHGGATNSEEIKWWVLFCGHLLSYAHNLTETGLKAEGIEKGAENVGRFEFLQKFTQGSILDHTVSPQEGKVFFRAKKIEYFSAHTERFRCVTGKMIQRMERVAKGEALGDAMEDAICQQAWFIRDVEEYDAAEMEDKEQIHRWAELERKREENTKRILERVARGARRQAAEEDKSRREIFELQGKHRTTDIEGLLAKKNDGTFW